MTNLTFQKRNVGIIAACFALFLLLLQALPAQSAGMNSVSVVSDSGTHEWTVELATTDEMRTKGLMFVKEMAQKSGMLFRFDQTRPVAMWMKNTFIPLDMVFTDEAGKVTHIHKGAVPHSLDIISSQGPARFVLEINAGEADAAKLKTGDVMRHPWFLVSQ